MCRTEQCVTSNWPSNRCPVCSSKTLSVIHLGWVFGGSVSRFLDFTSFSGWFDFPPFIHPAGDPSTCVYVYPSYYPPLHPPSLHPASQRSLPPLPPSVLLYRPSMHSSVLWFVLSIIVSRQISIFLPFIQVILPTMILVMWLVMVPLVKSWQPLERQTVYR